MKNSIIGKTLLILSSVIILLFAIVAYLFIQSDNTLIEKIRIHNFNNTMKTLDAMQDEQLKTSKIQIQAKIYGIAKNSAIFVYNYDKFGLEDSIKIAMKDDSIKAINIFDGSSNEIFLLTLKEDDKIVVSDNLPKYFDKYTKLVEMMYNTDSGTKENIGKVILYYDDTYIKNKIKALKKQSRTEIKKFNISIDKEKKDADMMKGYIAIVFFILILFFIAYLINKFVNQPLHIFKNGLKSFFDYLADSSKKVQSIDINTTDEFGQMTTSVNESIKVSMKMHGEIANLMNTMDKNVITTETDNDGIITYASKAFCEISGYSKDELIGQPHNIVRHPDMPQELFKELWETIQSGKVWYREVKNIRKDGSFYWIQRIITPKCTMSGASCGYTAIGYDITDKKEVEDLTENLEIKIEERTVDLNIAKKEIEQILANILLPVLITSKKDRKILYANKYAEQQYEMSLEKIIGSNIDDVYTVKGQQEDIIEAIKKYGFLENSEESFKTNTGKEFTALLSVTPITYKNEESYIGMVTDITKQKEMENEVRAIHKHTRESIEYASLIQSALIPENKEMRKYFKDQFVIWHPKDTVGGDIYLFEKLRNNNECLLMYIDCTGHGVPGAFVTMLVKAVEREIVSIIMNSPDMDVSPAWAMAYFNKTLKKLLKQEDKNSISNAGWDGGIIYYNKKTQILKFCGAETPLFYIDNDGEFHTVKGNRYSVGYKKCDANYKYKEIILEVKEGMKFYCTTDGYLDQNGGEKDFPFGKKRFGNIIKEYHTETMADQQEMFLYEMATYEEMIPNNDRNDDITLIGFEIGVKSNFQEDTLEEIVKYEGVMTQNVIASCMDNIESKITNMNMIATVSTITIEYCQNMMNYSKGIRVTDTNNIVPAGIIEVQYHSNENNEYYKVTSTNIISQSDKEKIEPKLIEIQSLDKVGIKKRYRELRKSGQNTHEKGGGIGLYEIAKVSDSIEYSFTAINEDKYTFNMKSFVKPKVRES